MRFHDGSYHKLCMFCLSILAHHTPSFYISTHANLQSGLSFLVCLLNLLPIFSISYTNLWIYNKKQKIDLSQTHIIRVLFPHSKEPTLFIIYGMENKI